MGSGTGPPLEPPGRPRTFEASVRVSERAVLGLDPRTSRRKRGSFSFSASIGAVLRDACFARSSGRGLQWALSNESNQANRAISTGKLHALLRFHTRPINVVVYHGSQGRTRFEVGFSLRCFQRLSRPHIATLHCRWRDNSSTRGASIPVLSY